MTILLFLCMIITPIAEIAVLIKVGGRIGVLPTVSIVILTALIGTMLLRQQGMATLIKVQDSLAQNRFPLAEVFDGFCLLVAGVLLLTPGFVTDTVGLLLFIPIFRSALRTILWRHLNASGHINVGANNSDEFNDPATIIEGEFHEVSGNNEAQDNINEKPKLPPFTT